MRGGQQNGIALTGFMGLAIFKSKWLLSRKGTGEAAKEER